MDHVFVRLPNKRYAAVYNTSKLTPKLLCKYLLAILESKGDFVKPLGEPVLFWQYHKGRGSDGILSGRVPLSTLNVHVAAVL